MKTLFFGRLAPVLALVAAAAGWFDLAGAAEEEAGFIWAFDREPVGQLPPRFLAGPGWAVAAEPSAPTRPNVLAVDLSSQTNAFTSVCAIDKLQMGSGLIWTRVNVASGMAGIVFRLRGSNSYDMLTISPVGSRLQMIAVRDGVGQELASCALKTTFGRWHRVGVEMDGRMISCYFDGEMRLTVADDLASLGKGGIGLVVSGGGRAMFDDVNADAEAPAERIRRLESTVEVVVSQTQITVGGSPMAMPQLIDHLTQHFEKNQRLLLLVEKETDYEHIEQVMKAACGVGFEKIVLELRK